jgi:hypothetical protein
MDEIDLGMSNFDHTIDKGFESALREQPNKVFGRHSAWNFNGKVWFDGKMFREEVWVHRVPQETVVEPTLSQLMEEVNSQYGYE